MSQPSICSPWHGTSLKFLKIAGMLMPPAPLFPTPRQILLFLYPLQGPFLSRAEGGGLGGRRTSVLRFPVYSQDGLSLCTLVCRPGVPSPKRSLGCFLFHEPSLKFFSRLALSSPGSSFWFLLLFSWTHSLFLANFKLACPLMRNSPAKHGLPGSGSACCHRQGLIVWQPSAIMTELSHILPALPR